LPVKDKSSAHCKRHAYRAKQHHLTNANASNPFQRHSNLTLQTPRIPFSTTSSPVANVSFSKQSTLAFSIRRLIFRAKIQTFFHSHKTFPTELQPKTPPPPQNHPTPRQSPPPLRKNTTPTRQKRNPILAKTKSRLQKNAITTPPKPIPILAKACSYPHANPFLSPHKPNHIVAQTKSYHNTNLVLTSQKLNHR